MKKWILAIIFLGFISTGLAGEQDSKAGSEVTVTLGAYTVPKEAYQKEIIPAFQKYWLDKTGQKVRFEESYQASGAQSRSILAGFEADIAALSLEDDVEKLREANLITHDWKDNPNKGFVTRSIVVIGYREGNPKNIQGWEDLTKAGIGVLYPSPKTSGGAMWDVNAIYGAGLKMTEINTGKKDYDYAKKLLKSIQKNVKVMDNSGRASVTTFENGVGDAIVTYENELLLRKNEGREIPFIIPEATILIENPIAIVDKNVDKHKNREVVEAFVQFTLTKEAQRAFAKCGFRPVDQAVAAEVAKKYPEPKYLFTMDYLGGWKSVQKDIYGAEGVWTRIINELGNE